jgi:orotate phosphoribosyltransferase
VTPQDVEKLKGFMQGCFKYDGPYTLSSGRTAQYYYDGKGATQDPAAAWLIGNALIDVVIESEAEAIGGLEIGAVPIADAIGLAAYLTHGVRVPTFIVRKEAKAYGTRSQVSEANQPDGSPLLREGRRVAIVDDVITTGGSIQKAIDVVRSLGCVVTAVATIVERHESEEKALRGQGFPVHRLFYTNEAGELFVDGEFARRAAGSESPAARR